jgi:hypothetical protein
MNEKATPMLWAAAALSVFAAVLASTANAYVPEGAGVPAEAYAPSMPVSEQQTPQTSVREKLGELGAWAVPSTSQQQPLSQQTSVREKLGELGAWAVPSISHQTQSPLATHPTIPDVDPSTFAGYRG